MKSLNQLCQHGISLQFVAFIRLRPHHPIPFGIPLNAIHFHGEDRFGLHLRGDLQAGERAGSGGYGFLGDHLAVGHFDRHTRHLHPVHAYLDHEGTIR